jgi:diguanylate cyclase (GGDEF)-like protein
MRLSEDLGAIWLRATTGAQAAVLYLDLDGFKAFNDAYGHDSGDALLRAIGEVLRVEAGGDGAVYRVGGDEFVVVGSRLDGDAASRLADRIVGAVALIGSTQGSKVKRVTVSIGIAVAQSGDSPDAVLASADRALYRAKRAGKSRFHLAAADGSEARRIAA